MEPRPRRQWWYFTSTRGQSLFLSAFAAAAAILQWWRIVQGDTATWRVVFACAFSVLALVYLASALARTKD